MGQKNTLYFCAGLAIGILGTLGFLWFYQEPDEEPVQPIVDIPSKEQLTQETLNVDGKSSIDDYKAPAEMVDYTTIANALYGSSNLRVDEINQKDTTPYRITEEQYEEGNEQGNYDLFGLTLYCDGVLANDITDDVLTEAEAFTEIGPNFTIDKLREIFTREPQCLDDVVYVRNDKLFTQYEITYDLRTYKEVTDRNPDDGSYGT